MESQPQASHPSHGRCKSSNIGGIYTFPPHDHEPSLPYRLIKLSPETSSLGWARTKCRSGPISVAKSRKVGSQDHRCLFGSFSDYLKQKLSTQFRPPAPAADIVPVRRLRSSPPISITSQVGRLRS